MGSTPRPSWNTSSERASVDNSQWELALTIIELCLCIAVLVGNGIVIAAYMRVKKLQNLLPYFFLIHLAIADLIVGISTPIKAVTYFLPDSWTNHYRCILQFTVIATPLGASALFLLIITSERYYSVMNPYSSSRRWSKALKYTLIVIAWLIPASLLFTLPFLWTGENKQGDLCNLVSGVPEEYWEFVILPVTYALLLAVTIMYIRILMVAKEQMDNIRVLVVQVRKIDRKSMQNIKLMKTGFMLLGLFLICWLPFAITLTITLAGNLIHDTPLLMIRLCTATLTTVSSALNPFIYAVRIRQFRIEMKKILHLPITYADKVDTYEIKRTFKIRRPKSFETPSMIYRRMGSKSSIVNRPASPKTPLDLNGQDRRSLAETLAKMRAELDDNKTSAIALGSGEQIPDNGEDEYISVTVTRTVQDISDSEEDDDNDVSGESKPIRRQTSLVPKQLLNDQTQSNLAIKQTPPVIKSAKLRRKDRRLRVAKSYQPTTYTEQELPVKELASRGRRNSSDGLPLVASPETMEVEVSDAETLTKLLNNRDIVSTISLNDNCATFQLAADQIDFQLDRRQDGEESGRSRSFRNWSIHRRHRSISLGKSTRKGQYELGRGKTSKSFK